MKLRKIFLLFCTVLLCSCRVTIDVGSYSYEGDDEDFEKGNTTIETSDLDILNIDWIAGNVTVEYYDGDVIQIEENEEDLLNSQKLRYYYNKSDNELCIKFCKSGIELKKLENLKKDLFIYLPQDSKIKLLEFDGASANIKANKVICSKYKINTASGNADLIINGETKSVDIDTASGDAILTGDCVKEFNFDSASGDITIATSIAPDKGSCDVASGETYFYFPDDIPGFQITFKTASGDFHVKGSDFSVDISGKKYSFGNVDKNTPSYSVNSASGDVYIKKLSDFSN